jgi:hypothetical protein
MTTVELKNELITNWKKRTRVLDLAVQYGMAKSTVSTTSGFKRRRESTSEGYFLWNMSHLPSSNISPLHLFFLLDNVRMILCI